MNSTVKLLRMKYIIYVNKKNNIVWVIWKELHMMIGLRNFPIKAWLCSILKFDCVNKINNLYFKNYF